jgi:hypothetical protein
MKAHSLLLVILSATLGLHFTSCTNPDRDKTDKRPESHIAFEATVYDFGEIPYESDGKCTFSFKNTSDEPLVINTVRTSCGCTSPEWPEEPVEPGESGTIGVTYNTSISGSFNKSITVYCNASNSPVKLFIKGTVQPKPETSKTN